VGGASDAVAASERALEQGLEALSRPHAGHELVPGLGLIGHRDIG